MLNFSPFILNIQQTISRSTGYPAKRAEVLQSVLLQGEWH